MWAYGDSERVSHYSGDDYTKMWGINLKDAPNISDFYDAISERWDADHEKGTLPSSLEETYGDADEFLKYIDPDDIVDSAGVWDDLDAVDWLGEFFEEIGVDTIRLWDGAISFNPKSKRIVKLGEYSEELPVIQDNETSGQVLYQPAGMKPSLPQRFAELPGVEADSSQWFGEGKAIESKGKDRLKALQQWAKTKFSQGTALKNADTGWDVQVTPNGIKSSLHHGYDDLLARSVPFIPQIIESGIHVDSIRKTPRLMSHIFANKIRLDGKDYVVGFVVREDGNGNRFYNHELTEIIDPDWHNHAELPEGMGGQWARANRGDVMNILRDKLGVNDGSGQVLFQTAWHGTPHRQGAMAADSSLPRRFAELPGVEADSSQWFGEGKAIAADGRNARKAVVDWARTVFPQGTTIKNADQGWDVQVTPRGIKNSLAHGGDDTLIRSVPFIPQIIESAVYVDSIPKTSRLMSHIFANKIRLDGQDYVVGFVVREDQNGNRFTIMS